MTSAGGLVPVDAAAPSVPAGAAAVGPGRRGAGRGRGRRGQRVRRRRHLRHGRHEHRRLPRARRRARAGGRARRSAGFPIRLPSLDVHTIGAGGGSIARLDAGGALRRRARSRPAPCPGRPATGCGGTEPDGHRRRPRRRPHPGRRRLPGHRPARRRRARRRRSTGAGRRPPTGCSRWSTRRWSRPSAPCRSRGASTRERLALVAFGGAGPLHACGLADALGMAAVIVPPRAGVLSAVGLLCAPRAARPGPLVADADRPRRARRRARRARPPSARPRSGGAGARRVETRGRLPLRARATS